MSKLTPMILLMNKATKIGFDFIVIFYVPNQLKIIICIVIKYMYSVFRYLNTRIILTNLTTY